MTVEEAQAQADALMAQHAEDSRFFINIGVVAYYLTKGEIAIHDRVLDMMSALFIDPETACMFARLVIGFPVEVSATLGAMLIKTASHGLSLTEEQISLLETLREQLSSERMVDQIDRARVLSNTRTKQDTLFNKMKSAFTFSSKAGSGNN